MSKGAVAKKYQPYRKLAEELALKRAMHEKALREIVAECLAHHAEYGDHPHRCLTIAQRALND